MANETNKLELLIKIFRPRFLKNIKLDLACFPPLLPKWDPFSASAS